jgi:hypothetical protein
MQRLRAKAAKQGWSPEHGLTRGVAEGFQLKGYSHLTKTPDGDPIWLKATQDAEAQALAMRSAIDALKDEIPKEKPVKAPGPKNSDLLNCYVVTDYHLGMLAWHEEAGEDWDIKVAEDMLVAWFQKAIDLSPDADVGYFAQIGDFLHWDGLDAVTPQSGHVLDADTRFQKLIRVALRVLRRVIRMLLEKHKHVYLLMADANHDPASESWLREFWAMHYDDEPRITVDTSADSYYCHEHGLTSLFFHHGHKRKPSNIHGVFAAKFREVFGRTKYSYGHMGHLHHIDVKENELMVVEQHRTLAAKDAYAAKGGWLSGRSASVITYSKQFGEVSRLTINPEMLRAQ